MRHAKFISTLLIGLPFVCAVILNGSMVHGKIKYSSDIDLLIIARRGHLFTARALCILVTWLTGRKRSSDDRRPHAGRICLNYFLTNEYLTIPHNRSDEINHYCAVNYSDSILLTGDEALFDKFMKANMGWMSRYLSGKPECRNPKSESLCQSSEKQADSTSKSRFIIAPYLAPVIARSNRRSDLGFKLLFEKILSGGLGQCLENYLKCVQLNRIDKDPRTKKYPDLIVVNDREMRFHPPKYR